MMAWLICYSLGGLLGESEVPVACQRDGALPTNTHERLEVTMCAAHDRMASLTHLQDSDVSQLAIEVATAPTFTILDEVIATSTPLWQGVALDLRGDLFVEMAARLRHAGASSSRVSPWLASARRAYADARTLRLGVEGATTNPDKETQL
jgi:hypothetical protein